MYNFCLSKELPIHLIILQSHFDSAFYALDFILKKYNVMCGILTCLDKLYWQDINCLFIENRVQKTNECFVCQKCGRGYKHEYNLEKHNSKNECGVAPQFNCPTCSYSSKRRSNLKKHVERINNSASSSKENDTGLDDEMKDAAAGEGDSDSNCSDGTHGNNQN